MTNAEVLTRVRRSLSDTVGGSDGSSYRWSDTVLLDLLDSAIKQVSRDRPDSRYDAEGELVSAPLEASRTSDTFPLDTKWADHAATLTAALALEMDSADTANREQAVYYRNVYGRLVAT